MSRIAEASARAGRAVPDNPRVEWAKEREAAERLLRDTAPEEAAPSQPSVASSPSVDPIEHTSRPTVASSRPLDSIEQTFQWPPQFDLDAIDLSQDPNARNFRRPSARTQAPHERRVEFDDETSRHHSPFRNDAVPSSPRGASAPPRETAASAKRGNGREPARAEARHLTLRWVVIAAALLVLLASAALLMYLLRNRQVTGHRNVQPLASSALWTPMSIDMPVSPTVDASFSR
jgi:hypothetical protein